jgi:xanthine dehydrogenase accessory factor
VKDSSILVLGVGAAASAIARMFLLSGFAVALHQTEAPRALCRKMDFSDAWHEGEAMLDGVEARRATSSAMFLAGLRNRAFIPLLTNPLAEVLERWPWEALIDVRPAEERRYEKIRGRADLTIALGGPAVAGEDYDLVIEVDGPDPGAVIRNGPARASSNNWKAGRFMHVMASKAGIFEGLAQIGGLLDDGTPLGRVGDVLFSAPAPGRLRGLYRTGSFVVANEIVAEIAHDPSAVVSGCDRAVLSIARAVLFAVEMELSGIKPISPGDFF